MEILTQTMTNDGGIVYQFQNVDAEQWKKQQLANIDWFNETFKKNHRAVSMDTETVSEVATPRKTREGTKQQQAVEMYRNFNGTREEFVQKLVKELNMTEKGATTYYYNCKKIVGK